MRERSFGLYFKPNNALQWTPTLRDFLRHSLRSVYGAKTRSVPGPLNLALCGIITERCNEWLS
jgi:hypothetical protein